MGTLTKGAVGEQDLKRWDGTGEKTFARETSSGGRVVLNKIGHEVDALISYGQGTNYTAACINAAITAIGSVVTRLILRPGTWDVNANVTVPANITAVIPAGCVLYVGSGITITFNGPVEADAHDWQSGSGTFTIGSPSYLNIKNAHVQLKGDARLIRFNDTGASGVEWGIRSDGGNFEILENEGTEASPTWTARATISSGTTPTALTVNMRGDRNVTKCWFYLDAAPTGWTIDETPADALLCVKGGSNAYNTAGGAQAGTWTQPNHLHTIAHTHAGPSHSHTLYFGGRSDGAAVLVYDKTRMQSGSTLTADSSAFNFGGSQGGNDYYYCTTAAGGTGNTGDSSAANSGNSATAATWRPLAQIGIICVLT